MTAHPPDRQRPSADPPVVEPQTLTLRVLAGFRLSRAVWLATRLRLADLIGPGPTSVTDIARASGTDAGSLERLLNALAAAGVFRRDGYGRFGPTPASDLLRSDHPRSQRAWLEVVLGGEHFEAWGAMETAIRTGRTAFEIRHGTTSIDYYRTHPDAGRAFAEAMSATTRAFEDAILDADPFPAISLAVDVGGSHGSLLRRLLERNPDARGVLFDLPEVIDGWRADGGNELEGRLTAAAGDFFHAVPEGGDLYLLKFILHDWDDQRAEAILRRVRDAVGPGGRLAIIEMVLPDLPTEHPGWLMDLNMLALTGGRERTRRAFETLVERGGMVARANSRHRLAAERPPGKGRLRPGRRDGRRDQPRSPHPEMLDSAPWTRAITIPARGRTTAPRAQRLGLARCPHPSEATVPTRSAPRPMERVRVARPARQPTAAGGDSRSSWRARSRSAERRRARPTRSAPRPRRSPPPPSLAPGLARLARVRTAR